MTLAILFASQCAVVAGLVLRTLGIALGGVD